MAFVFCKDKIFKITKIFKIMFLQLSHTKLEVFQQSKLLALECYKVTKLFPAEEKFAIIQQIRRQRF
jgi:hypothetical protein